MRVDLFLPVVEEHRQHLIFRQLCPRQAAEREVLPNSNRGFADREGKLVKEFQTTFESSMWEPYMHACIRETGGVVDFGPARPDFVGNQCGAELCIEATVAQPTAGDPPESPADLNEFNRDPIVRISSRFTAKSDHCLERNSALPHVKDKPFVIALASFDRPAAQLAHDHPIIAALYGLYFDEEQSIATRSSDVIPYPLSTVPKSVYTEHLLDGLYVIHNPNVRHPLGFDTLARERIAQLSLSEGGALLGTGPDAFLPVRFVFSLTTR